MTHDWRKRFNVGHAIHHMIQSDFELMSHWSKGTLTFDKEVKVQDTALAKRLFIASSCDGVFTFWNNGTPYLRVGVEIKSASPDSFSKLNGPEDKHVKQSHLYMACLDLPLMWVVYWNKGNQNMTPSARPYLFRFNPATWAEQEQRARSAIAHADDYKLPEREEGLYCRWCKYAWTCQPKSSAATASTSRPRRTILPILR